MYGMTGRIPGFQIQYFMNLDALKKIYFIGIGGIDSPETALAKIEAGATLIQLYTGMIYEGPSLIGRIKQHLAAEVRRSRATRITDLTGRRAAEWAGRDLTG